MVDIPSSEPASVVAGDTLAWKLTLGDYPASSGWVLSYALRNDQAAIDITASASGSDHLVSVPASTSKTWRAGSYAWSAFVTKASERYTVGNGTIIVAPNLAVGGPVDSRSHARRVLDAIEAVLERRATKDQEEFTIGDRSLKRTPLAELIRLRSVYRGEVRREQQALDIAAGRDSGNRILVRFGGAR